MKRYGFLLLSLLLLNIVVFTFPVSADDSLTIQVGIYENEPKIFTDGNGNPAGFWPDIIEYIALQENWDIEYVHGTWEQCLSRLKTGEIDIMPDVAFSEERGGLYDFCNETVYVSWSSVYTRDNTEIQSILDLEGKNIAVLKGSINYQGPEGIKTLTDEFNINCTFTETDSYLRVFGLVASGAADAGVVSKDFGHLNEADYHIQKTSIIFQPASLKFTFTKGSALTPLLRERVDYQVRNLKSNQNSILYQSMENWLGVKPEEKTVLPEWVIWLIVGTFGLVLAIIIGHHVMKGQVRTRTRELMVEIDKRKQTEARNLNLNSVLRALREINQLIVHEKDRESLIRQSCNLMVKTHGMYCAWILLLDKEKKPVMAASANSKEMSAFTKQLEQGKYPPCLDRILANESPFAVCSSLTGGNDSCLVRNSYKVGDGFISRLEYSGKVYGIISIYVPNEYVADAEEQSLFQELAGDIAFALYKMELEEENKKAQEQIMGLAKFPDENPNPVLRIALDGQVLYANKGAAPILESWNVKTGEFVEGEYRELINRAVSENHVIETEKEIHGRVYSCFITPITGSGYVNVYGIDISERRQVETRLRESEKKYRSLVDNSDDAVLLTNPNGGIEAANPAACRIFGRTEQEICKVGRNGIVDLSDPRLESLLEARARTGKTRGELIFKRKDGTSFPGEITSVLFTDNHGNVKTSMTIRDISERVKMEEALRQSETQHRTLFETMVQGVVYQSANGEIIGANPAAERILGLTVDQMMGRTSVDPRWKATHEDGSDYPGDTHPAMIALKTGEPVRDVVMAVFHPIDNKYHWIIISATPLIKPGETKPYQVYTTFTDITERMLAEEKLNALSQHQDTILSAVPDIIMEVDNNKVYTWANQAGKDFFGEDVIGKEASSYFLGEQKTYQTVQPIFEGSEDTIYVESYQRRKDGEKRLLAWWCRNLKDGRGNITGALSAATDITEQKEDEEILRASELFNSSLLENAPNPINVINPDTSIRYVNPALEKLTGFSFAELIGQKAPYPFWGEQVGEQYINRLNEAMISGVKDFERQFTRKNGEKFWIRLTNMPVKKDGELDYLLSSWIDITETKQAEDELILRARLLDSASDGICLFDTEGKYVYVNDMYCRVHGCSKEELIGTNIRQMDKTATSEWFEWLENELKQKEFAVFETNHYHKDGSTIRLEVNSAEIKVGDTIYNLSVERDITERKETEQSLRLSDTTLKSINEAVIAIDNDNRVTFWNAKSEELFGIKVSEAIGQEFLNLITIIEEYPGQDEKRKKALWGTGHNREEQLYCTPKGDIWVDAHAQVIEDENGRYGWVILAVDITGRRKMEATLKESEEKFSEVFYANPNPMSIVAPDTAVINDINEAFTKASGYTREECIGKTTSRLGFWVSEKDRAEFVRKLTEQEIVINYETEMRIKSGEIRNVLLSTKMIRISGKQYAVISSDDITERKKMQEQFMVTDRLASIGELAAGIAHELNNPLTGVIGFSDLLMARNDIPEDVMEDLTIINKEAVRASQVARHLLTFARKHPDEKRPVNINEIIQLVLKLRAYEQRVNNIEVILNLSDNLPAVLANDFQLQQVFINIIINAEFFMIEEHGRGQLEITTEKLGEMVRTSITDNGPGIPPENLTHIFDPFYTTKEVGKGTGLGLSICFGVITEHGGKIWADSEPGKGAKFIIELPVHVE